MAGFTTAFPTSFKGELPQAVSSLNLALPRNLFDEQIPLLDYSKRSQIPQLLLGAPEYPAVDGLVILPEF